MSKNKYKQVQPDDGPNKDNTSATDNDQNQSSQPNKSTDDFMKPFISNKDDEPEEAGTTESEEATPDNDQLSKTKDESIVEGESTETPSETLGNAEPEANEDSDDSLDDNESTLISEPLSKNGDKESEEYNDASSDDQATLITGPMKTDDLESTPSELDEEFTEDEEAKEDKDKKRNNRKKKKLGRIRLIPIWVRLVIIITALLVSLALGAMVGYGIVGEGGDPLDIFDVETWYHIYDMIFEGTDRQR
jgi:phosphate/sulfate permease